MTSCYTWWRHEDADCSLVRKEKVSFANWCSFEHAIMMMQESSEPWHMLMPQHLSPISPVAPHVPPPGTPRVHSAGLQLAPLFTACRVYPANLQEHLSFKSLPRWIEARRRSANKKHNHVYNGFETSCKYLPCVCQCCLPADIDRSDERLKAWRLVSVPQLSHGWKTGILKRSRATVHDKRF